MKGKHTHSTLYFPGPIYTSSGRHRVGPRRSQRTGSVGELWWKPYASRGAKRSKSVCPHVHMLEKCYRLFQQIEGHWEPCMFACFYSFSHLCVYVLKAIQKEKSSVAIKFAGTFMIYVLFSFFCNNDKIYWNSIIFFAFLNFRFRG